MTKDNYIGDFKKPKAFIFDIDGTLAFRRNRSPYDWSQVFHDIPNAPVVYCLNALKEAGYKIIIFTGRDAVCKKDTKDWLAFFDIEYDHFAMRPKGNVENDAIIKRRMFDKVRDKYNIIGVYDDRDRVVKMWRELGLICLQVAEGNF